MLESFDETVTVAVPVTRACEGWAGFKYFPDFMSVPEPSLPDVGQRSSLDEMWPEFDAGIGEVVQPYSLGEPVGLSPANRPSLLWNFTTAVWTSECSAHRWSSGCSPPWQRSAYVGIGGLLPEGLQQGGQ